VQEKRQAEEAEAAAKQEAHRRRVESLKAWMATVYGKMREQRQRQAAEESAQAHAQVAQLRARVLPQAGGSQGGLGRVVIQTQGWSAGTCSNVVHLPGTLNKGKHCVGLFQRTADYLAF
jgi:hypothetical protein